MSISLNDQQVLQIIQHLHKSMAAEEHQRLLDVDHLDTFKRKQIKPLYPHKVVTQNSVKKLQKFGCGQICCQLSSGSTCCACFCKIHPPSTTYQDFGLGFNIFFNFLKHISFCLIVLGLFSVISIGIAYYIALNNDIAPMSSYQLFFFSTTIGSFSSSYFKCRYSTLNTTGVVTFNLDCPQGQIHELGPVLTENSQESLTNCKNQRYRFQQQSTKYYIPPSSYTITRPSSCTKDSCKVQVSIPSKTSGSLISYPFACVDPTYPFFNKTRIQIRVLIYVFVGIDLFITLGLLFFLCSQMKGEDEEIDHFKKFQLSLKDFSLKIKGFNSSTFDEEFYSLLGILGRRQGDLSEHIIQIKTPDDQQYQSMVENRKQKYQELFEFMQRNFFQPQINPFEFSNGQDFIKGTFPTTDNYLQFKKQLHELLDNYRNSRQIPQKQQKDMQIYLVMNSGSDLSMIRKMRKKFCCDSYLVGEKNKYYTVQEAPIPDMLQWQNKSKWTCVRVIFSWIITLAIVLGSYILFGWIQWQQKQLLSDYNFKIDCALFYPTESTLLTFNSTLYDVNQVQYTHCYCSKNYFSFNVSDQVSQHCSAWQKSYLLYLIIPLLISVGLVVYNLIVSILFKKISQFEGHFFVTDEMFSYILKRSFILVMNMSLIIVILNFNFDKSLSPKQLLFLFQGQYDDITSDWYISIGSIIIMTMIFNISFPFMELFMTSMFKCFRKCVDKRCWTKKTSQKYKNQYISLYSSDIYPIEERYALIISIFWITVLFNCVIPVLNIIAALSLVLLFWIDKVLVFKFFKTPMNFDESLHRKFMKTLYIGLILHMVVSAFFLSEPNLIPKQSNFSNFDSFTSSNQRVNSLIQTYYIIPYVALLVLMIVYGLFKQTLINLLSSCNKKIERQSMYKIRNTQSFFQSLNQFQLYRLKAMAEKEIYRLQNIKRQKQNMMNSINMTTEESQLYINPYPSISNKLGQPQKDKQLCPEINFQLQIYIRTYDTIMKCLQYYQKGTMERRARLIGMPGYELSVNEAESEKDKKMLQLDSVIEQVILIRR